MVPVEEEPLHIVRYKGDDFMIYTNWIEPGVWTQYHSHGHDLLSVLPVAAAGAMQTLGSEPLTKTAPAGTVLFFPYSGKPEPYVHRVGAEGEGPFVNIGLDFRDDLSAACASDAASWQADGVELVETNRRGQAYRLTLPAGSEVALPQNGRGLLVVPLQPASLEVDSTPWQAAVGDFRFYDDALPTALSNSAGQAVQLIVFSAC